MCASLTLDLHDDNSYTRVQISFKYSFPLFTVDSSTEHEMTTRKKKNVWLQKRRPFVEDHSIQILFVKK